MRETSWKMTEQDRQDALAKLRGLRPIDDDFMRCIFRDNIPLAEFVLRILTGIKDLKVLRLDTQKDLKRLAGARSICLDVTATDNTGRKLDLEIQRSDRGAGSKRARYHSSAMDIENLDAGQDFDELPETYTIFITEKDIFGAGKPFYPVERINMTTGEPFIDGEHILYVNGTYRDDTEIGRLMHDFCCWNADDMQFELMRDITRYFKETEEGVEYMCKAFEETEKRGFERGMQEGVQQGVDMERLRSIKSIMSTLQVSATQAMNSLNIPKEQQAQYAAQL